MPYPGKDGMAPGNPLNGMNGENGMNGRELGAITPGLGIEVATDVTEEGVDAEVDEESEVIIELEPDDSEVLGIERALAG